MKIRRKNIVKFADNRWTLICLIVIYLLVSSVQHASFVFQPAVFIQIACALLLLVFNKTYNIVRHVGVLPAGFYMLLILINPLYYTDLRGSIISLILIVCLFLFYTTYQNMHAQVAAFNISMLICASSFYWQPVVWLTPICWCGMYRFQSLNIRSFFAVWIGFFTVYLLIFTGLLMTDNLVYLTAYFVGFKQLIEWQPVVDFARNWMFFIWLAILIYAGFRLTFMDVSEKIRLLLFFRNLVGLGWLLLGLWFVQNQWAMEWGMLLHVPCSLLLGYFCARK